MTDFSKRIAELSPKKRALLIMRLKKKMADEGKPTVIPGRMDTNSFPMSFSQRRMWFLNQLVPESGLYNINAAVHLKGILDVPALTKSLNEIINRHECLRARFITQKGEPVQVIDREATITIPMIDLRQFSVADREPQTRKLALEEGKQPFDLALGPLLRVRLLRLAEEEHVLLVTMHHIISDGWSIAVFTRELSILYQAHVLHSPISLPGLPIQYADYAEWQTQLMLGEELKSQLSYWQQQLEDCSVLELPTEYPRLTGLKYDGKKATFTLPSNLALALKSLRSQENTTLFMIMLTAFKILLHHYTGQDDICVGTPVANRNRPEVEGLIGLFVNTLVLRTDLSSNPGFRELLQRVKKCVLDALSHQDLPFDKLVQELGFERTQGQTPLFQVMFDLQGDPLEFLNLPGMETELLDLDTETAKFDLTLTVLDKPAGLTVIFEYNTSLFKPATIQRMAGHYKNVLAEIVQEPNKRLSDFFILTDKERHQVIIEWNDTRFDCGGTNHTVAELFEAQAKRTPNARAVIFGKDSLSYSELNRRADLLAQHLQFLGVGPEVIVGLYLERSVDMIIGLLGILKAGGAYLPLDPSYPADRLFFILQDAQVQILVTQKKFKSALLVKDCQVVYIDADDYVSETGRKKPAQGVAPENMAYVIYTSGSTGQPKGVIIQHRSVINLWCQLARIIKAKQPDEQLHVSLNAPLLFDASVQQLVMLLSGHCLYVVPHDIRLDGHQLLAFLRHHKIQVLDCVPSQLKLLLEAGLLNNSGWIPPIILPGGEAIDPSTWQILTETSAVDCYNMYGPTECTVDSTISHIKKLLPTIGRPINNTKVYILSPHLQPVPVGIPGELYIGGAGLARGYLNRSDLTAEKFVPDPFSNEPGARLYRTGDRVRYLEDGNIEFLGRLDYQEKIRGFRIETGEIEAVLARHPAVKEAVVLARDDTTGTKRLFAFLVGNYEPVPSRKELRQFVRAKLPEYMVPSIFTWLEKMPLTPNGKINRKALPAIDQSFYPDEKKYIYPRTPTEEIVASIWSRILGVSKVGALDNFFELGGHSLLATKVVSQLREAFQVELPLNYLFERPVLADLAAIIDELQKEGKGLELPPIGRISREADIYPHLSFAQERLWFLEQLQPGSSFYNIASAIQIKGRLNLTAFEKSINEIVRRHEILRTVFPTLNGKGVQKILPVMPVKVELIDLRGRPEAIQKLESERQALAEARRPFDLTHGPLLRVNLLQIRDDENIAILSMHHIISDGWSIGIMINEISRLYNAFVTEKPSPVPQLSIQYIDYAQWQREWFQGRVLEQQLSYWKKQLQSSPPLLELPTDRPRPAEQTFRGACKVFFLPENVADSLRVLSQKQGVTLFMTLLATFQVLLYRYSGQTDINVGTPVANRNHLAIEDLIGFFVNTLVLRVDLSGNPAFTDLLQQVKKVALAAYLHQDLPFEKLVDELKPHRDLSHAPLFQVMFALQHAPIGTIKLSNLELNPMWVDTGTAKFDLTVSMEESENGLSGLVEYNTDLFNTSTIDRMLSHFQILLASIVADPGQRITRLRMLTELEIQQILVDWNSTQIQYPDSSCLHQLFEAQVEKTPDYPAVIFENRQVSYHELNRQANKIAHYLRKQGIGPEVLVGIYMERAIEMIIAILAIQKAGAAYLPLDPSYPEDRITFMIQDAGVAILLTQNRLTERLDKYQGQVLCLDSNWQLFDIEPGTNPRNLATPENLAYVIYTSGSTGIPKGVMVSHRGVCNFINFYTRLFNIKTDDRILQFFSFSFDGSVADIFTALSSGSTLCLIGKDNLLPGPELNQFLHEQEISLAILPPSALTVLPTDDLEKLKILASGGDSTSLDIIRRWAPGRKYFNVYGPTEASVVVAVYLTNELAENMTSIPIGRPIQNVKLFLLDKNLEPVPIGVAGELHISGIALARGYLNRPEITAEKFIPNPFGNEPGTRLYKTGDLARYLPDGKLQYLGRIDNQVKVRGFRIELEEIETVLNQHPAIRQAAVIVRDDDPGKKRLVGYVVPMNGSIPSETLKTFLQQKLPDYMIPSTFVTVKSLPITPNGKLDKKALPLPDSGRLSTESNVKKPRNPVEKELEEIWGQVLGIKHVGIHDNFFELGGDSILTIQVIARAKQAGLSLTPKNIFQFPTIAELATKAEVHMNCQKEPAIITGSVPLTPIQHWFFEQNLAEPQHWNQAVLLEVNRPLDPDLVGQTIQHLVLHHDALWLRFRQSKSGWEQIHAEVKESVPYYHINLANLTEKNLDTVIMSTAKEMQTSLDLTQGPLVKVAYFANGDSLPARLLLVIHHLVVDAVSWRILLDDFYTIYQQLHHGTTVQLPVKSTSFQEWSRRLSTYAQSPEVEKEIGYWESISTTKIDPFPIDFPDGLNTVESGEQLVLSLTEAETWALVHEVPPVYGTDMNDLLLTGLAMAYFRWAGKKCLFLDLEGHGREPIFDDVDLSRTVGWFTSLYPVRLELKYSANPGEILKDLKEQLHHIPGRGIGYGLLRYSGRDEIVKRFQLLPQAEISFNYLGQLDQALPASVPFKPARESAGPSQSEKGRRSHKLAINGRITGAKLEMAFNYSKELQRQESISALGRRFMEALRDIIAFCKATKAGEYTPSDFRDVELSQHEVEEMVLELED